MGIDPVTLATIGQIVSTVGAGVGALSARQANAFQAAVAERNARIADDNMRRELERSQLEQQDQDQSAAQELGALLAEQAASGAIVSLGSSLLQRRATERLARRDAERIREEGVIRAANFGQQASDARIEAGQARRRRTFDIFSGGINIADSFIGGATQVNRARGLIS